VREGEEEEVVEEEGEDGGGGRKRRRRRDHLMSIVAHEFVFRNGRKATTPCPIKESVPVLNINLITYQKKKISNENASFEP